MERSNQENFHEEGKVNKDRKLYMSGNSDTQKNTKQESVWAREMSRQLRRSRRSSCGGPKFVSGYPHMVESSHLYLQLQEDLRLLTHTHVFIPQDQYIQELKM